jgi:hypothetical protein
MALWFFIHYVGTALWLGGGLAGMLIGIRSRRESPAAQGAVVRLQGALHQLVISPGAGLTVISGIFLTMQTMALGNAAPGGWLMVMQVGGMLGALLTLFVGLPTAARLARCEPEGPTAPLFNQLRRRQAQVGTLSGTLGWIALVAGAAMRAG